MAELKKELSLTTATLYGVGIILGAGIYVLIGQGAAIAGNSLWLSFVVAAFIAILTGLSYAELSGMFPKDAAEYVYTQHAFRKDSLAFVIEWIMLFTVVVSGATVALGFGSYFSALTGLSPILSAAGLVAVLSVVNYIGMKTSEKFNTTSTIIETAGLIIIAGLGIMYMSGSSVSIDFFASPTGLAGTLSATALIFFAYIGFEEIANLSEETANARKVIPKALLLSIIISTVLYIVVAVASIAVIGADALAQSPAPMADVASKLIPNGGLLLSLIALFSTANTVLVILIVGSRMLYGLSCNNAIPGICKQIGKSGTPYVSVFLVGVVSLALVIPGKIKTIALLTDVGIFVAYIFVNAALIALRYRQPGAKRSFRSPMNIGKFPVLALLGIISSAFMLLHFEPILIVYEIGIAAFGFILYLFFTRVAKAKEGYAPVEVRPKKNIRSKSRATKF